MNKLQNLMSQSTENKMQKLASSSRTNFALNNKQNNFWADNIHINPTKAAAEILQKHHEQLDKANMYIDYIQHLENQ